SREIVIVGPDLSRPGIGEIKDIAVRAPAGPVRDDDLIVQLVEREIGIKAVEGAVRPLLHGIHGSGDEAPALVYLAVVDPVVVPARLRIDDEVHVAGLEVEEVKAASKREHRAALLS